MSSEQAWISVAIVELRQAGSWTGRLHIQSLLAFLCTMGCNGVPFEFRQDSRGVRSYDLDATIDTLTLHGLVDPEYVKAGYAPRYQLTPTCSNQLGGGERDTIRKAAQVLGQLGGEELALTIMCLWTETQEGIADEAKIIHRVRQLRPKYSAPLIGTYVAKARGLRTAFGAVSCE